MASTARVELISERKHLRSMEEEARLLTRPTICPTCRFRETRILEREGRDKRGRRVWLGRSLVTLLFLVVLAVVWWRLGDPMAGVMLQEGTR